MKMFRSAELLSHKGEIQQFVQVLVDRIVRNHHAIAIV